MALAGACPFTVASSFKIAVSSVMKWRMISFCQIAIDLESALVYSSRKPR